jgi:sugar lactone lactonase YvrE
MPRVCRLRSPAPNRSAAEAARTNGRIAGQNTQLSFPIGVAVDSNGYLYVADCGNGNVKVYAPGADRNTFPIRVIPLSSGCTIGLAIDANDRLYVTSSDQTHNLISEYSSEPSGNTLLRTIDEPKPFAGTIARAPGSTASWFSRTAPTATSSRRPS